MSEPSCRNTSIADDLDLSSSLDGRAAEILTDDQTYVSLVNVVNSFLSPDDDDFDAHSSPKR